MPSWLKEVARVLKVVFFFVLLPLFLAPSCKPHSAGSSLVLPPAPLGLTATAVSTTQINLAWSNVPAVATTVEISRSLDGGVTWTSLTSVPAAQTTYNDAGLTPSTEYCYRVRSIAGTLPGPWSPMACATTIVVSSVTTTGGPPAARMGHTMIFDPNVATPTNPRLVAFGGLVAGPPAIATDELWILDLTTSAWSMVPKAGLWPSGRMNHSAILDDVNNRMVLFGGYDGTPGNELDELWSLDLGTLTWVVLTTTGGSSPFAREGHTAIFDPNPAPRMLVFGGEDIVGSFDDVWELTLPPLPSVSNPSTWTDRTPALPGPAARSALCSVFTSSGSGAMTVFGGHDPVLPAGPFKDVWQLSLGTTPAWSTIAPVGGPTSRFGHSAVLRGSSVMIFGGSTGVVTAELWQLNLGASPSWSPATLGTPAPGARLGHAAAFDPATTTMYLFGGGTAPGTPAFGDVWKFAM